MAIFLTCMSVRVSRPKLFKNLCLSLVSGVPPLLYYDYTPVDCVGGLLFPYYFPV